MSDFDTYAQKMRTATITMNNDGKLRMYGLFKQATVGDQTASKPGMLSGLEARAKWKAWESEKGKMKDDAAKEYVTVAKGCLGEA